MIRVTESCGHSESLSQVGCLPSCRLGAATTPNHRNRASHGGRGHAELRPNHSSPSAAADVYEGPGPV